MREEIARLKGLKGRPKLAPSGMEEARARRGAGQGSKTGRRGGKLKRLVIDEERVIGARVPAGSRFKGYQDYVVQDLILRPHVIRFRRARWLTPAGKTIVAPLPAGIAGHYGPELRRYVLAQYHQGQVTVPRLVGERNDLGLDISKRAGDASADRGPGWLCRRGGRGLCAPGSKRPPGSRWTTPAPATRPRTACAPRSATSVSPGSPPPHPRAG